MRIGAAPFPTNPINALEAREKEKLEEERRVVFPTNPINALEARFSSWAFCGRAGARFPTNPINALEARARCARTNAIVL